MLAAALVITQSVLADGLIFQFPVDGTWVKYSGKLSVEIKPSGAKEWVKTDGTAEIRVCSNGAVTRAERPCRWIEINMRTWQDGVKDPVGVNDLRVLVPERYLTRGSDPLERPALTYWNLKDADRLGLKDEPGFDRFRYEIDRFLISFPPPLTDEQQLPPLDVETPAGTFKGCEVIAGTSHFDRPTKDEGRWEIRSRWKIALHDDAPFGVARIDLEESEGVEISQGGGRIKVRGASSLKLSEVGTNADSWLQGNEMGGR
jgi:hypothetical protein